MSNQHLAYYQLEVRNEMLTSLVMRCRERYLQACQLLGVPPTQIDKVLRFGLVEGFDVARLFLAWEVLCKRYLKECYNAQIGMFVDAETEKEQEWSHYAYENLLPYLVSNDEFVRNILRMYEVLSCESHADVLSSLESLLRRIELP